MTYTHFAVDKNGKTGAKLFFKIWHVYNTSCYPLVLRRIFTYLSLLKILYFKGLLTVFNIFTAPTKNTTDYFISIYMRKEFSIL